MKPQYDLVIVIPIGPNSSPRFISDTIESIVFYVKCSCKIVIADNSQRKLGALLKQEFPTIDTLVTRKDLGKMGGQYINLSNAYKYVLDHYDFELILRMDDDALIIAEGPERQAKLLFASHPDIGIAGRHITGRYSYDCYGNLHDNVYSRNTIIAATCTLKFMRRPVVNMALRKLVFRAFKNGYELGENIQGGAYFISRECIRKLDNAGLLPMYAMTRSILCEDHIFSMLTKVVGMRLQDLSDMGGPFACAWKGLPASPEELDGSNKKIIHSVRYWKQWDEADIRSYFKVRRVEGSATKIRLNRTSLN